MKIMKMFAVSASLLFAFVCADGSETKNDSVISKAASEWVETIDFWSPRKSETRHDSVVLVPVPELNGIIDHDYERADGIDLERGNVFMTKNLSEILVISHLTSEINENGLLVARVFAEAKKKNFFDWTFSTIRPYVLRFTFLWYDKNGKLLGNDAKNVFTPREVFPGNLVRFSALAPSENARYFSFAIERVCGENESAEDEKERANRAGERSISPEREDVPIDERFIWKDEDQAEVPEDETEEDVVIPNEDEDLDIEDFDIDKALENYSEYDTTIENDSNSEESDVWNEDFEDAVIEDTVIEDSGEDVEAETEAEDTPVDNSIDDDFEMIDNIELEDTSTEDLIQNAENEDAANEDVDLEDAENSVVEVKEPVIEKKTPAKTPVKVNTGDLYEGMDDKIK